MLYLVRHGETEWNAAGRFQGAQDSPLTRRGRDQAAAIGRLLAARIGAARPITCYVSPLGRARQTADIVAHEIQVARIAEPRIAEVTLGAWDGMSRYEIEAEYPGALAGATAFDWYFRAPGGERFDAVCARVSAWLRDVDTPAVAISHGLLGRIVRGLYLGMSVPEMLALPVPQDGVFCLDGGRVEFLGVPR
ncbi:MAG TPA: histidine phosphatase family protein [Hyphomicrobiales bacterium]|nr:histidine phosphatase family protein [Hyphomicrobiales bacterium]